MESTRLGRAAWHWVSGLPITEHDSEQSTPSPGLGFLTVDQLRALESSANALAPLPCLRACICRELSPGGSQLFSRGAVQRPRPEQGHGQNREWGHCAFLGVKTSSWEISLLISQTGLTVPVCEMQAHTQRQETGNPTNS